MQKQIFIPFLGLSLFIIAIACSNKKENKENETDGHQEHAVSDDSWEEMDDFHMIMAESFHPYKDSANLEPAKQNADSLIAAAAKWASAPIPEKFAEDEEIKFKLTQLKADATTFAEVVKTGNDKAVGESLTKLHDLFHTIQEAWYQEDEAESH